VGGGLIGHCVPPTVERDRRACLIDIYSNYFTILEASDASALEIHLM